MKSKKAPEVFDLPKLKLEVALEVAAKALDRPTHPMNTRSGRPETLMPTRELCLLHEKAQGSELLRKRIEQEIKDTEDRYAHVLTGSLATIQINAPRALMQIEATTKLCALHWVLGRQYESRFKGKLNS